MKKIITTALLAIIIATPSMAAEKASSAEKRYGVGADIISGNTMVRISMDGIVDNLRIDGRVGFSRTTTAAGLSTSGLGFGVGAYYGLSKYISAGGHFDTTDANFGNQTRIAAVLKVEDEILKDVAIGIEFGYENVSISAGTTTLSQYSAVTIRTFF